jgi:hypothetical protein
VTGTPAPDQPAAPVLRVVRGNPDAEELAAIVTVLAAASASAAATDAYRPRPSAWAAHSRSVRAPLPSGGWARSTAPR